MHSVLQQVAATVSALTVVLGALWWVVAPRVREYVRAQQAAAAQLLPTAPAQPDSIADKLDQVLDGQALLARRAQSNAEAIGRLDGRMTAIEKRVTDHGIRGLAAQRELREYVDTRFTSLDQEAERVSRNLTDHDKGEAGL